MTEKQAKDLREQREGRRIDVEAGNDRYDIEFGQCLDVLIPCRTAQYLIVLWLEVNRICTVSVRKNVLVISQISPYTIYPSFDLGH